MPSKNRALDGLWNSKDATELESFTVTRQESELLIEVGKAYLFVHPGINIQSATPPTYDQLWKGLVTEIKTHPSQTDVLLNVIWFWSKKDIRQALKGNTIGTDLALLLESMAKNEICVGSLHVVNSSNSVSCDVDVVYLESNPNMLRSQEPVVNYFFRMNWDEAQQVIKASPPGCGKQSCTQTWNPDRQEQRYCEECNQWYHVSCVRRARDQTQLSMRDKDSQCRGLPTALCDVAYQPIARGEPSHFTAGNIRIVMKARDLLRSAEERNRVTDGVEWDSQNWMEYLHKYFDLEEGGDSNAETLLTLDQKVYQCSCSALI